MNSLIDVKNLKKFYGTNKALNETNFAVYENEIFGLLGANGAGKTTTLECIESLREYDGGSISVMGLSPEDALKKGITGIQLQSSSLPDLITAKEAMKLFCTWRGVDFRNDLLDTFGFKNMYNKYYKSMSTGQKRRLHLALALAHNPKILFLDEPTAGLDVEGRVTLHEEIKKLKKMGVTIILASHDMAEVESLCDRVGIMVKGNIKTFGTPKEIALKTKNECSILLKTDKKIDFDFFNFEIDKNGYYKIKTEKILETIHEIINYIKSNDAQLLDIYLEQPSLEQRFIEITKEAQD